MTTLSPRRKLIEVSIPLEAINAETKRRKQKAPKGYPTSFHKYWAQRPVAACRALIFAQLVDDPGACPNDFPTKALQGAERERLHKLLKRLVTWEASTNEAILSEARYEIARSIARDRGDTLPPYDPTQSQTIVAYLQEYAPAIHDPFSGAGTIPLEAQRLGLRAIATDLNPVAVLIGKALVELPSKFANRKPVNPNVNKLHQWRGAQGLAADLRHYGAWVHEQAQKRIDHLYPKVRLTDGAAELRAIAWFWARTVRSPDPRARGAHVPLVSSFVLSARAGNEVIVRPEVDRSKMTWALRVDNSPSNDAFNTAKRGTKTARSTFSCLLTGTPIGGEYIDAEAQAGRMLERLMAVVADRPRGRVYVDPIAKHAAAAKSAAELLSDRSGELELPTQNCRGTFASNAQGRRYKFNTFADYFTARQLVAMTTFSDIVKEVQREVLSDAKNHWAGGNADDERPLRSGGMGPAAYSEALVVLLSIVLARMALYGSSLCKWLIKDNAMASAIAQKGIEMTYDYVEGNPLEKSSSGIITCCEAVAGCLEYTAPIVPAQVEQHDIQRTPFCRDAVIATDPPYLDNVGYADLSDYFYVWHRRTLKSVLPDLFRRVLTPKNEEIVASAFRHRGQAETFFMQAMTAALKNIENAARSHYPVTLFYAYKQSEVDVDGQSSAGWAAFLQAVLNSGLAVDATWPLRTENTAALKNDVNALASSILLVCRVRDISAPTITRTDFLRALRREMPAALAEIRRAGVGPTDIQQAAIGPGIGIFTRYSKVLNTDGMSMLVRDALKLINQVREEITSSSDADYDNETRFAIDWFSAKGFDKGRSGDAIGMTNAVDVSLDGMNAAGFFLADGGIARLLKREELPDDWDPANDNGATVWEACQHLIKRLRAEDGGIDAAAALCNRLGGLAEPAHALARRLYDICEQNDWAAEGYVYNQLHQEWDTIEKRAAALVEAGPARDLFSR
jgi:putative DNA methylase